MKIYVASSWRNEQQPTVVEALRAAGHEVYDFRHPKPGDDGFHWSEIDPDWRNWDARTFREALGHPLAKAGFAYDLNALNWADAVVLVLPCNRSSHLELGYGIGAGKHTIVLLDGGEPELMYLAADALCVTLDELVSVVAEMEGRPSA